MSDSLVTAWAEQACDAPEFQYPQCGSLITTLYAVITGEIAPDEAARRMTAVVRPLIEEGSQSPDPTVIWRIFCTAVRALGAQKIINKRLLELFTSIQQINVKDGQGSELKHGWGGADWTDLPTFDACFRDYCISESLHNNQFIPSQCSTV